MAAGEVAEDFAHVASRVGAGIEIPNGVLIFLRFGVASRVGAGIEMNARVPNHSAWPSRPVWARGLK